MSSFRSRNGGTVIGKTLSRLKRPLRNMLAAPFGDLSPRCDHHQKWQRLERIINASIRVSFPSAVGLRGRKWPGTQTILRGSKTASMVETILQFYVDLVR